MSERLASSLPEFDKKQVGALREIGQRALAISAENYCSGFPNFEGGKLFKLGHNNARHNFAVGRDSVRVGSAVGLDSSGIELARAAGNTHDIVQLKGRGTDEGESAAWIEEQLRQKGLFPKFAAKLAGAAILGTLPIFNERGDIIDQTANRMDFNSKYEEAFVKTIASADLGEIHTPIGPYMGHKVHAQLRGVAADEELPLDGLEAFQQSQLRLVEGYRYPLRKAGDVLSTHRIQVINYTEFVAEQLREGKIESGAQLTAQDLAFMRNPNMRLRQ